MGADQKRKEARRRKFGTQTDLEQTERQPAKREALQRSDTKDQTLREQQPQDSEAQLDATLPENETLSRKDSEKLVVPITTGARDEEHDATEQSTVTRAQRFIVFIGNLPFTATDDSITKHFAKVHPQSIRHRTDRATGKSKGFAFLEFNAYDRMKTCLKLYHHSNFDDGQSPARRLNVELTYALLSFFKQTQACDEWHHVLTLTSVGGGGAKSKDRKAKLRLKNVKLTEERQRRAEIEKDAKTEGKPGDTKSAKGHPKSNAGEANNEQISGSDELHGDIHPSRRNRLLL